MAEEIKKQTKTRSTSRMSKMWRSGGEDADEDED